jgi:hypothetical protein
MISTPIQQVKQVETTRNNNYNELNEIRRAHYLFFHVNPQDPLSLSSSLVSLSF